jgi:hypothetical protein
LAGSAISLRDSRRGIRLLRRDPLFTAAAIVSLALGIGANTAMFSLMDAVILRMMPAHEPQRLVQFARDRSYPLFRRFSLGLYGVLSYAVRKMRETTVIVRA